MGYLSSTDGYTKIAKKHVQGLSAQASPLTPGTYAVVLFGMFNQTVVIDDIPTESAAITEMQALALTTFCSPCVAGGPQSVLLETAAGVWNTLIPAVAIRGLVATESTYYPGKYCVICFGADFSPINSMPIADDIDTLADATAQCNTLAGELLCNCL